MGGDLRKFGDGQLVAIGQHHGAEKGVFELADIARPVIGREHGHRLGGQAANPLALLGAETGEKAPREIGDVGAARPQRRDGNGEDVEPVIEILAEAALLHLFDQVLVGGRDQADVDAHRLAGADRVDLAFLQARAAA